MASSRAPRSSAPRCGHGASLREPAPPDSGAGHSFPLLRQGTNEPARGCVGYGRGGWPGCSAASPVPLWKAQGIPKVCMLGIPAG